MFEAVDLDGHRLDPSKTPQTAIYDDGVCTQTFTPLRIASGATGWGFSRNVKHLYKELARVYDRVGQPSPINHVLFIMKENRSYDQVFGDLKQGNGDPSLTLFGRDVTPNQHAVHLGVRQISPVATVRHVCSAQEGDIRLWPRRARPLRSGISRDL